MRPKVDLECGNWNHANQAGYMAMPIINDVTSNSLTDKMRTWEQNECQVPTTSLLSEILLPPHMYAVWHSPYFLPGW